MAPEYHKLSTVQQVAQQFQQNGSIELAGFIAADRYKQLMQALAKSSWEHRGPYNIRSYEVTKGKSAVLTQFKEFLQSVELGAYIERISGVALQSCSCEIQKFGARSYTLAHDNDPEIRKSGMDCIVTLIDGAWDSDVMGGSRHYILPGEEEELVVIEPKGNTLALVYRDEVVDAEGPAGIMHFTKFVNHRAKTPMF